MFRVITLFSFLLFTQYSYAKTVTINKGTKKEAVVTIEKDNVYITYHGKKNSAEHVGLEERVGLRGSEDLESELLRLEDINSDGFVDIAVLSMIGRSGVTMCYDFYLAKDRFKKSNSLTLCTYEKVSKNRINGLSKSNSHIYNYIYKITKKNDIKLMFSYENYENYGLNFCGLFNEEGAKGIVSCEKLENELKLVDVYKKVEKKSYLYNKDYTKTKMYLIKGDVVKLIEYEPEEEFILVEFKGIKTIKKYIKVDNLK